MPEQKQHGILWGIVNSLIGLFAGLYAGSWLLKVFVYHGESDLVTYERLVASRITAPDTFWQSIALLGLGACAGLLGGLAVTFIQLWRGQRAYTRALRAVSVSKDAFISMVLHHIRTPLTGIKWVLAAFDSGDKGNLLTLENLHALKIENERAITAVNKLLEAARVSSEQTTYQIEIRPLAEVYKLLEEHIEATRTVAAAKHISLNAVLTPPPTETYIAIDREKIQIILEGLLNNAIKYTEPGGAISVEMKVVGRRLHLTVSDTGIGIPVDQKDKIFSQFFRADNARVKEPDGFGVGLFVSKTFVEHLKGSIAFTSEIGKGTAFTVELPLIADTGERYLTGLTSTPVKPQPIGSAPKV